VKPCSTTYDYRPVGDRPDTEARVKARAKSVRGRCHLGLLREHCQDAIDVVAPISCNLGAGRSAGNGRIGVQREGAAAGLF
jgi:hypothetical protein